ncbi:hypothetical protein LIER_01135 [Lithospermum erythrorhizon]|uniref:Uncharacterized protein n=1 Tax=Lithospermum erythrorhizon TaxID=34254 RepID=A0AAV3NJV7_LITER
MQLVPQQPLTKMSPVLSAIPFSMWGIELVGQFLKPPVKYKDVVVAGQGPNELEELSGKAIDHTWHEVYLKKYYL